MSEEKIGQKAKKFFSNILKNGNLQTDMIENLQDKLYSKEYFGTNFSVLTKQINNNNKARYYSKPIFDTYYLTNDWYSKNIEKLNDFIKISNKKFNARSSLNQALKDTDIDLGKLIAKTALFVSPETAQYLKSNNTNDEYIWRENCKRKESSKGKKGYADDGIYLDDNTIANGAIKKALGYDPKEFYEYEVCHIWHKSCYDIRYHTSIVNLVLIPRSIAALSDFNIDIIKLLQYRAYELYNWYPKTYKIDGSDFNPSQPQKPNNYNYEWQEPLPFNDKVKKYIDNRKIKKGNKMDYKKAWENMLNFVEKHGKDGIIKNKDGRVGQLVTRSDFTEEDGDYEAYIICDDKKIYYGENMNEILNDGWLLQ